VIRQLAPGAPPQLISVAYSAVPAHGFDFAAFRRHRRTRSAPTYLAEWHIAGLVAAGCPPRPSPLPVWSRTTHPRRPCVGPAGGFDPHKTANLAAQFDKAVVSGGKGGRWSMLVAARGGMAFAERRSTQASRALQASRWWPTPSAWAERLIERGLAGRPVAPITPGLIDAAFGRLTGKVAESADERYVNCHRQ